MKCFKRLLSLGMAALMVASSYASAHASIIPPLKYQNLVVGDDGYVQLHQYITPVPDANSYKDEMTLSVSVVQPPMDIVMVVDGSKQIDRIPGSPSGRSAWDQICDGIAAAGAIFLDPTKNPNGENGATRTRLWVVVYDKDAYIMDASGGLRSISDAALGAAGNYFTGDDTAAKYPRLVQLNAPTSAAGSAANYTQFMSAVSALRASNWPATAVNQRYIAKGLARAYDIFFDTTPIANRSYLGTNNQQEAARKCIFLLSSGGDFEDEFLTSGATVSGVNPNEVLLESVMRKEAIYVAKALKAPTDTYEWYINPTDKMPYIQTATVPTLPPGTPPNAITSPIWYSFWDSIVPEMQGDPTGPPGSQIPTGQNAVDPQFIERYVHEVRSSSINAPLGSYDTRNASDLPQNLALVSPLSVTPNPDTLAATAIDDLQIPGVDGFTIKKNEPALSDTYDSIQKRGGMGAEIWTIALDTGTGTNGDAPATRPTEGKDTAAIAQTQINMVVNNQSYGSSNLASFDNSGYDWHITRDYGVRSLSNSDLGTSDNPTWEQYSLLSPPAVIPINVPQNDDDIWLHSLTSHPTVTANYPGNSSYNRVSYIPDIAGSQLGQSTLDAFFPTNRGTPGDPETAVTPQPGGSLYPQSIPITNFGTQGDIIGSLYTSTTALTKVNDPQPLPTGAAAKPYDPTVNGISGGHDDRTAEYLMVLAGTYAGASQGMSSPWSEEYSTYGWKRLSDARQTYAYDFYRDTTLFYYNIGTPPSQVMDNRIDGIYWSKTIYNYFIDVFSYTERIGMEISLDGYRKAVEEYRQNNLNSSKPDEYPLQYRWVTAQSDNQMVKWQFMKYAYEMFCVSQGGIAENEISSHYACNRDAVTSLTSVIPLEFLDGAGVAGSSQHLVTWTLPRIYLGTIYKLTFTAEFLDANVLPATMMYPLSAGAYAKLKVITMMPGFGSGNRFHTLDSVTRQFPYGLLPAISGNAIDQPEEEEDYRLRDYVPNGPQASSAVFTLPTANTLVPYTPSVIQVVEDKLDAGVQEQTVFQAGE